MFSIESLIENLSSQIIHQNVRKFEKKIHETFEWYFLLQWCSSATELASSIPKMEDPETEALDDRCHGASQKRNGGTRETGEPRKNLIYNVYQRIRQKFTLWVKFS